MKAWIKRTLLELSTGAMIGFVIWCLFGKQLTSMLFGSLASSVNCQPDVRVALDKFVAMQLYSALVGAVVAFLGMLLIRRWWAKSRAKRDPAAPTAPSAPGAAG